MPQTESFTSFLTLNMPIPTTVEPYQIYMGFFIFLGLFVLMYCWLLDGGRKGGKGGRKGRKIGKRLQQNKLAVMDNNGNQGRRQFKFSLSSSSSSLGSSNDHHPNPIPPPTPTQHIPQPPLPHTQSPTSSRPHPTTKPESLQSLLNSTVRKFTHYAYNYPEAEHQILGVYRTPEEIMAERQPYLGRNFMGDREEQERKRKEREQQRKKEEKEKEMLRQKQKKEETTLFNKYANPEIKKTQSQTQQPTPTPPNKQQKDPKPTIIVHQPHKDQKKSNSVSNPTNNVLANNTIKPATQSLFDYDLLMSNKAPVDGKQNTQQKKPVPVAFSLGSIKKKDQFNIFGNMTNVVKQEPDKTPKQPQKPSIPTPTIKIPQKNQLPPKQQQPQSPKTPRFAPQPPTQPSQPLTQPTQPPKPTTQPPHHPKPTIQPTHAHKPITTPAQYLQNIIKYSQTFSAKVQISTFIGNLNGSKSDPLQLWNFATDYIKTINVNNHDQVVTFTYKIWQAIVHKFMKNSNIKDGFERMPPKERNKQIEKNCINTYVTIINIYRVMGYQAIWLGVFGKTLKLLQFLFKRKEPIKQWKKLELIQNGYVTLDGDVSSKYHSRIDFLTYFLLGLTAFDPLQIFLQVSQKTGQTYSFIDQIKRYNYKWQYRQFWLLISAVRQNHIDSYFKIPFWTNVLSVLYLPLLKSAKSPQSPQSAQFPTLSKWIIKHIRELTKTVDKSTEGKALTDQEYTDPANRYQFEGDQFIGGIKTLGRGIDTREREMRWGKWEEFRERCSIFYYFWRIDAV